MSTSAEYIPGVAELGRKNQAGGYAGLDENGDLIGPIINRSMTYDELMDGVVPEVGELVYCSDTLDLHIGDGVTVGGRFHSAPSIERPLQNLGVPIASTSFVTLCDMPVKASCIYRMRAIIAFTDEAPTNNWMFRLPLGYSNLTDMVGLPMHGVISPFLPVMQARWGSILFEGQRMLDCGMYHDGISSWVTAALGDPVPSSASYCVIEMFATIMFSNSLTLPLSVRQNVTDALPITLLAGYSTISTQRIA